MKREKIGEWLKTEQRKEMILIDTEQRKEIILIDTERRKKNYL